MLHEGIIRIKKILKIGEGHPLPEYPFHDLQIFTPIMDQLSSVKAPLCYLIELYQVHINFLSNIQNLIAPTE